LSYLTGFDENHTHISHLTKSQRPMRLKFVLICAVSLLLGLTALSLGQTPVPSIKPPAVKLPKGEDAWAVHVVRMGGLTSKSGSDVMITSENKITCDTTPDVRCNSSLPEGVFRMLADLIRKSQFPTIKDKPKNSIECYDCNITAITLARREPNGKEHTYSGNWQASTTGTVSPDLIKIAQKILDLIP